MFCYLNQSVLLLSLLFSETTLASPTAVPSRGVADLPDVNIPKALLDSPLFGGTPDNDFTCKSSVHTNPVVLLHGLSGTRDFHLNKLAADMKKKGYCTFSKTYGAHSLVPWIGGVTAMRDSAKDIAAWIKEVKDKTGAKKVDVVGYSEGAVMALYVPMTQPGIAGILDRTVSIGPAVHGAQYYGLTSLAYAGGEVTRKIAETIIKTLGCPACDDMATGGAIANDFKAAKKIVQPGVKASIIMSTSDGLVAPSTSRVDEPGVRNVLVQDKCPDDKVGHAGYMWDTGVWEMVLNELSGNYDAKVHCDKGLSI